MVIFYYNRYSNLRTCIRNVSLIITTANTNNMSNICTTCYPTLPASQNASTAAAIQPVLKTLTSNRQSVDGKRFYILLEHSQELDLSMLIFDEPAGAAKDNRGVNNAAGAVVVAAAVVVVVVAAATSDDAASTPCQ